MNKKTDKRKKPLWRRVLPFAVFLAGLLLVVFAARELWTGWRDDVSARNEYAELRESFEPQLEYTFERPVEEQADTRIDMSEFSAINPDFVGWISIAGIYLSYPIVQGQDNVTYLDTTFRGERNPAGAIFMDYRATQVFDAPVTMLHGHNMRDGSMFAALLEYLNPDFLAEHPELVIITAEGERLVYQIFDARWTTAWDYVYTLDYDNAVIGELIETVPVDASRILLLSTCGSDSDRNARVVVYAVLRDS